MLRKLLIILCLWPVTILAQINTERVLMIGRNALYYEDYVLSIQYFNQVINAKPWMYEPYFFRGVAKFYLDDFQGGEVDCSAAIERNPFVTDAYQVRGLCRINQGKYALAADDYREAVHNDPENQGFRQNLALCLMEAKKYAEAEAELDQLSARWPNYAKAYAIKAQVALIQKDTVRATQLLDKSLEMDPKEGDGWSMRAILSLQQEKYKEAESELDKAIQLQPKMAGNYINRALARYNQDNLRGAMSDYNTALDIAPDSYLGHFNRGLLRAQVGEDNLAIEDLNFVLAQEPDNMIILFNRALLLDNTGDYRGAIRDITRVIKEYPNFWTGYMYRAQIRRKIGDSRGAEADEFRVLKAQIERRYSGKRPQTKIRKKSDKNMEDYNKLVVADNTEVEHQYASSYRGRVQNRTVTAELQPLYVLGFYEKNNAVKHFIAYHRTVDALNDEQIFPKRLLLTNNELPLDSADIQRHFEAIAKATQQIADEPARAQHYFVRAVSFFLVQDFDNAISDLSKSISLDADNVLAYFLRGIVRLKALEVQRANVSAEAKKTADVHSAAPTTNIDYRSAVDDLQKVVSLAPDFAVAYYDLGNAYAQNKDYGRAIDAYAKAIGIDAHFADAYYNRGLSYLFSGDKDRGLSDLSKAGELGLYSAYSLIRQYSTEGKEQKGKK